MNLSGEGEEGQTVNSLSVFGSWQKSRYLGRTGARDDGFNFADAISGEAALHCMFADGCFIGCDVDAVNLVGGDVAVHPLDLGTQVAEDATGLLRDCVKFFGLEVARSGDVAFDDVFGHGQDCRAVVSSQLSVVSQNPLKQNRLPPQRTQPWPSPWAPVTTVLRLGRRGDLAQDFGRRSRYANAICEPQLELHALEHGFKGRLEERELRLRRNKDHVDRRAVALRERDQPIALDLHIARGIAERRLRLHNDRAPFYAINCYSLGFAGCFDAT